MTERHQSDSRRHREEDMTPEEWAAHCERMKVRYAAAASSLMMFTDKQTVGEAEEKAAGEAGDEAREGLRKEAGGEASPKDEY